MEFVTLRNHNALPVHEVWFAEILYPGSQLAHFLAPCLVQSAPDDAMPLEHEHTLATQLNPSPLTLQPVSQLATTHAEL